jgi:hypothetical protein
MSEFAALLPRWKWPQATAHGASSPKNDIAITVRVVAKLVDVEAVLAGSEARDAALHRHQTVRSARTQLPS